MITPARTIFMGTGELACATLSALAQAPFISLLAAVSQPDKPKGRELKLQPTPVKTEAAKWNVPVLQPNRARDPEFIERLRELAPDLIVVAAYGQILPQALLDIPRVGCLNVHTSLLPKYRGAAPIQWALLNGESETGVTIMKMDAGLDTGPMLAQAKTLIEPADNAQTLHDRLATMGAALLLRTIPEYLEGRIQPQPQPAEGVSYARKISKEDGRIDWSKPAKSIWNRLRAFTPWPGVFTFWPKENQPRLLKIWEAAPLEHNSGKPGEIVSADKTGIVVACGEGTLRITLLQVEGGRRMNAAEFLTGHALHQGARFQ